MDLTKAKKEITFENQPLIIENLEAGNIKKDVSILGVTGTYESGGGSSYAVGELFFGTKTSLTADDFMIDDGGTPLVVPSIGNGMYNLLYFIENVTIPEGVEEIFGDVDEVFQGLGGNTDGCVISFPTTLTAIDHAFNESTLSQIGSFIPLLVIPDNVQAIQDSFRLATIYEVDIGSGIEYIGSSFFSYDLSELTIRATTPPQLYNSFYGGNLQAIFVPASAVSDYQNDANWAQFASIIQAIPEN